MRLLNPPAFQNVSIRRLLVPLALLGLVGIVLLEGWLQRVPASPDDPQPPPAPRSPLPMPGLRPDLEKTPLAYFSDYWLQLGRRVSPRLVAVGRARVPALVLRPGWAVSPQQVSGALLEERARVSLLDARATPRMRADALAPPELIGLDARLGLALLALPDQARPAFEAAGGAAQPGALVAAVGLDTAGEPIVAPGYVVASPQPEAEGVAQALPVSLTLPSGMLAAAIVDLDGRLLGGAFESDGRWRIWSAATLAAVVERLQQRPGCLAIEVGPLAPEVRRQLGIEHGVLVEHVVEAAFSPKPSLRAGDVVLEWAGRRVNEPATFEELYRAGTPGRLVRYAALRDGAPRAGATRLPGPGCRPADEAPLVLPRLGAALRLPAAHGSEPGWLVLAVAPESPAEAAGLREADVIVAAGRARSVRDVLDAFEKSPRAMLLRVRRQGRIRLLVVDRPEA